MPKEAREFSEEDGWKMQRHPHRERERAPKKGVNLHPLRSLEADRRLLRAARPLRWAQR